MARIPQLGMPVYRGLIQTAFAYPAIQETTGLNEALPSSEPATAQISYTIQASDLPTLTGTQVSFKLSPGVFARLTTTAGFYNPISWKALLNGTSVATGSTGITNSSYEVIISVNYWGGTPPQVGDVLTIKLWGSGVYLRAHAYLMDVTRILHGTKRLFLADAYAPLPITIESSEPKPSFSVAGNSSVNLQYLFPAAVTIATGYYPDTHVLPAIYSNTTLGLMKSFGDHSSQANAASNELIGSGKSYARKRIVNLRLLPLNVKL